MKQKRQVSRASELRSGRPAPGMFKGNGPDRKVSVAQALRNAANSTSTKRLDSVRGPSGQDGSVRGGGEFRSSGAFDGCRGYKYE